MNKATLIFDPNKYYYFLINQSYPCLSRTELDSLIEVLGEGEIIQEFSGVLLAKLDSEKTAINIQKKSSTIKESGRLLAISERSTEAISEAFRNLNYCPRGKPYLKSHHIQGSGRGFPSETTTNMVMKALKEKCEKTSVSWKEDKSTIRIIHTDGIVVIGELLSNERKGKILGKNPHNLPYYRPGALNPWFTRLLVNIGASHHKCILYDPFCGTGTIPLSWINDWKEEALCIEIREDSCRGALKNSGILGNPTLIHVVRADATRPPLRSKMHASVVTDPPYGRSVRSVGGTEERVVQLFLNNLPQVVDRGKIVLSMAHDTASKLRLPGEILKKRSCLMYVHNRLSREILLAERK